MRVVVCIKQIIDPEIPPSDFRIDPERKEAAQGTASLVISIFDENALESALQMRERGGNQGEIIALSVGPPSAIDVLRKALSLRADQAVLVTSEGQLDAFATARLLAAAIRQLGPVDLILCGREAGDWHGGQVGSFLAEEFGWPCLNFVSRIDLDGERFTMRRQSDEGWEVIQCQRPAVATVTNDETNVPRIPKVKDNMMAFRKQIPTWSLKDLGLDMNSVLGPNAKLELKDIYVPVSNKSCEMIEAETGPEKAAQLVDKLVQLRVL
ncbi:MAG: electron transfer flavoprotein subunit beta/FixA family protein [Acidobacteria bacterium]|nr:electron transfer flavoprotein subunit beta/FixA family protein [Acidobacteriota bacterium]